MPKAHKSVGKSILNAIYNRSSRSEPLTKDPIYSLYILCNLNLSVYFQHLSKVVPDKGLFSQNILHSELLSTLVLAVAKRSPVFMEILLKTFS